MVGLAKKKISASQVPGEQKLATRKLANFMVFGKMYNFKISVLEKYGAVFSRSRGSHFAFHVNYFVIESAQ